MGFESNTFTHDEGRSTVARFPALATTLVGALAIFTPASAKAQSYTLSVSSGPLSSIAGTGTPLFVAPTDDAASAISAGFSFRFFGAQVPSTTSLYASTNGMLSIGLNQIDYQNTTIPSSASPNGFIAPFWDDLQIPSGGTGNVYYVVQGSSGNRVLVVEWNQVSTLGTPPDTMTFQLRIYEASGNIEMYYGARTTGSSFAGTIGLEDPSGSYGLSADCFTPGTCTPSDVPEGTKLVFTPSSSPPPPPPTDVDFVIAAVDTPPSSVTAGESIALAYEVDNYGTTTSPTTDISVFAGRSSQVTPNDQFLTSATVSTISPNGYMTGTLYFTIPSGLSGTYYVAAIVDSSGSVSESDETNNVFALGAVTIGGGGNTIEVVTTSLPQATLGQPYSVTLQQSGATSPTWSLIDGSLPSGLRLSSSGVISGTPSSSGSSSFVVQAAQSGYTAGVGELSITVGGTTSGPRITTTSLPDATVGTDYQATISATGGTPPYGFQIIGERPEWIQLSSSGTFSGRPTAAGSYDLSISVFDSESRDGSATLHLEVTQPASLVLADSLPAAIVGQSYTAPVVHGGRPPYDLSLTGGSLPDGFSFDGASGALTGTPSQPGTWTLQVSANDAAGGHVSGTLTLTASRQSAVRVTVGAEVVLYTNSNIAYALSASGGVEPYTWSIVDGALPEGLSLDEGQIKGRVTHVSTSTVTFGVTDSAGQHAQATVHLKVQAYHGGGGGRSSDRNSGCVCVASPSPGSPSPLGGSPLFFVGLLTVLAVSRARRSARPTPPAAETGLRRRRHLV